MNYEEPRWTINDYLGQKCLPKPAAQTVSKSHDSQPYDSTEYINIFECGSQLACMDEIKL